MIKPITLELIPDSDYQTVPRLETVKPTGWNVIYWNKSYTGKSYVISYSNEQKAINAFNVLCKLESTWSAMLRYQDQQKASYMWML